MLDDGIVRNRLKIESAIKNARAFLALAEAEGSFDAWIWRFVGGKPIRGTSRGRGDILARTPLSDALSKELKKRGFNFVGSTIVYAFMQASGLVNDHLIGCFRRARGVPGRRRGLTARLIRACWTRTRRPMQLAARQLGTGAAQTVVGAEGQSPAQSWIMSKSAAPLPKFSSFRTTSLAPASIWNVLL